MGSPATLQLWPHMVHVWHIFSSADDGLTEADEALDAIRAFVAEIG